MNNPIFNALGNQQGNGFFQMIQQFNQFKNMFTGNPKEEVQKLLNSGQMSQAQFNQFQAMASEFQKML